MRERHCRHRVFPARHLEKRLCKLKLSTAQFEDVLAGKKMNRVPKGLRAPEQAGATNGIALAPIFIAQTLSALQRRPDHNDFREILGCDRRVKGGSSARAAPLPCRRNLSKASNMPPVSIGPT